MIPDRILILIVSVSVTFIKLSITNPTELQSWTSFKQRRDYNSMEALISFKLCILCSVVSFLF